MPIHTLLNLSINARRDSPFYCFTLRRNMDEVCCGLLVAYCVMDFPAKTLKFPTELGGRPVNQSSGPSWREVGKILHHTDLLVVYKVICVLKTSKCSFGSVEPSYSLILSPFHLGGSGVSIISSVLLLIVWVELILKLW